MAVLVAGPWLQWTRDTSCRIWCQLDSSGSVKVSAGGLSASATLGTDPFTGYVELTGLAASTRYTYRIEVDGVDAGLERSFRTMPAEGQPGVFQLLQISDHHDVDDPAVDAGYARLLKHADATEHLPSLCVINGDFEIPEPPHSTATDDLATRRTEMSLLRANGFPASNRNLFHGRIPSYCIWDDWDYLGNNSAGQIETAAARDAAATTYREFWAGSPSLVDSEAIYHSFVVADCLFILLDVRTKREGTPGSTGGPAIGSWDWQNDDDAWGATQIAWLKSELTAHASKPWKFIFTGCNIVDNVNSHTVAGPGRRDSVGIYHRRERNDIMQWMRDNPTAARGVIWWKGDDHLPHVNFGRKFREPEADPTVAGEGSLELGDMLVLASQIRFDPPADNLYEPWWGHPSEYFAAAVHGYWRVHVDTVQDPPVATFVLEDMGGQESYRIEGIDGRFYLERSLYRSAAGVGLIEPGEYASDSEPASTWTADPEP